MVACAYHQPFQIGLCRAVMSTVYAGYAAAQPGHRRTRATSFEYCRYNSAYHFSKRRLCVKR